MESVVGWPMLLKVTCLMFLNQGIATLNHVVKGMDQLRRRSLVRRERQRTRKALPTSYRRYTSGMLYITILC